MANGEADATSISLCLWSGIDRGTEPAVLCSADNLKWHIVCSLEISLLYVPICYARPYPVV
jgi:hypothetical protein